MCNNDQPDEEVQELMENHGLDEDTAERVRDIINEHSLDEDEAIELEELFDN